MHISSDSRIVRFVTGLTASVLAALVLSGCYTVGHVHLATSYGPSYVAYVSRDGSMPTEVFGNPFGDDNQADSKLVSTITLPNGHGAKPAHIVTAKDRAEGHRMVLVFNPEDKLIDGDKACEKTRFGTRPADDTFIIQAALCSHSKVISEARAEGPSASSIDDQRFQKMMYSLLAELLPQREGSRPYPCKNSDCS